MAGFTVFLRSIRKYIKSISSFFRNISCWGLLLGFIAFVSSRIWYISFVPAYSSHVTNSVVIAIGAAATLDKILSGIHKTDEFFYIFGRTIKLLGHVMRICNSERMLFLKYIEKKFISELELVHIHIFFEKAISVNLWTAKLFKK